MVVCLLALLPIFAFRMILNKYKSFLCQKASLRNTKVLHTTKNIIEIIHETQ